MFSDWLHGFIILLGFHEFLYLAIGIGIGLFVGVVPGLGGTTALVLLTPFTFSMTPVEALAIAGGIMGSVPMGGAVTAILLNTPGHASNISTCLDGYPLARQGKAGLAIGAAASSNALGGIIGMVSVLAVMPLAGKMMTLFGPPEFFLLAVLGLILVATTVRSHMLRALIAGAFGLMLTTVGYSDVTGAVRFTLGIDYLWDGVHLSPALIGLFAVAEMTNLIAKGGRVTNAEAPAEINGIRAGLLASFQNWGTLLRGSIIGSLLGSVPGIGGSVASFLSYGMTVRASKNPESFGKGNIKGVIATEAAINARDGSMLIPTLAFGIPGTPEMAVFMSILVIHGFQPGPMMLIKNAVEIYSLIWALTGACIISSFVGLLLARPISKLTRLDVHVLAPIVIAVAFTGSYAVDNEIGNVLVTLVFAAIGTLMIRFEFPRLPMVIAMVLGGIAERSFLQSMMMSDDNYTIFATRIVSIVLLALIVAALAVPRIAGFRAVMALRQKSGNRPATIRS